MGASLQLPQEAARLWGNPETRQRIIEMHARGDSLLKMVDELGLTPALEADGLRPVLESLSAEEVKIIRDAFVAEAAHIGANAGANFPVDCRVDNPGAGVRIIDAPSSRGATAPVARIESA